MLDWLHIFRHLDVNTYNDKFIWQKVNDGPNNRWINTNFNPPIFRVCRKTSPAYTIIKNNIMNFLEIFGTTGISLLQPWRCWNQTYIFYVFSDYRQLFSYRVMHIPLPVSLTGMSSSAVSGMTWIVSTLEQIKSPWYETFPNYFSVNFDHPCHKHLEHEKWLPSSGFHSDFSQPIPNTTQQNIATFAKKLRRFQTMYFLHNDLDLVHEFLLRCGWSGRQPSAYVMFHTYTNRG
jgi:hypothetical protein